MKPLLVANAGLAVAVLSSALGVVLVQHEVRKLFVESQELIREQDRLDVEWGMLQLEEGAWGTAVRVERVARERLQMRMPDRNEMVIIERQDKR